MPDARIIDLLRDARRPLLSYEFFPPKDESGLDRIEEHARRLLATGPDFVTVTWGAGGSTRRLTLAVCERLRAMGFGPVMPHLTCVGAARRELEETAGELHARGYRNIMALRGDPPKGQHQFRPHPDGLAHASELVALLRGRHPDLCIGVAGYPETHVEAASPEADLRHLGEKVDAGADFITTQLFFSNSRYFEFIRRCRQAGIGAPILAGLLPVLSLKQTRRFTGLCGASLPPPLAAALEEAGGEGPEAERVGVVWTAAQAEGLLAAGVPGIHLYVLNQSRAAMTAAMQACFGAGRGAR